MSITADAMTVASKNPHGKTLFAICFSSADANGGEIVKAAPSAGSIYLTKWQISWDADVEGIGTLGDGTTDIQFVGTPTGLANPLITPCHPIKLAATTALTLTCTAGDVSGYVEGFVEA